MPCIDLSWHSSAIPWCKNSSPHLGTGRTFFKQEMCVLLFYRNGKGRNPFLHATFSNCLVLKITNRPKCHVLGCCALSLITSCPEEMEHNEEMQVCLSLGWKFCTFESMRLGGKIHTKIAVTILRRHAAITRAKVSICRLSAIHDHLQGQAGGKPLKLPMTQVPWLWKQVLFSWSRITPLVQFQPQKSYILINCKCLAHKAVSTRL